MLLSPHGPLHSLFPLIAFSSRWIALAKLQIISKFRLHLMELSLGENCQFIEAGKWVSGSRENKTRTTK